MIDKKPRVRNASCRNRLLVGGNDLAKQGMPHRLSGNTGKLIGRGVMLLVVEPVRIFETGAFKPHFFCPFVHQGAKSLFAPSHADGNGKSGVIGGGEQKSIQKLLHRQRLSRRQIDRRSLDSHRFCGHGKGALRIATLQRYQSRHDFGGAGHAHGQMRILFKENRLALRLDENRALGGYRRGRRPLCERQRGRRQATAKKEGYNTENGQNSLDHSRHLTVGFSARETDSLHYIKEREGSCGESLKTAPRPCSFQRET